MLDDDNLEVAKTSSLSAVAQALTDPQGPLLQALGQMAHNILLAAPRRDFPMPSEKKNADDLMKCLRVVNQAEDLVTDSSFKTARNNDNLAKRLDPKTDKSTEEAIGLVYKRDQSLADRFRAIYRKFDCEETEPASMVERLGRMSEIFRLREDLAILFSS